MTVEDYILSQLERLKEPIIHKGVGNVSLEDAILARVMSKKFRKLRADQAAIDTAKHAIKLAVEAGEPIRTMLFFGGNKLWRLDEAPHIEWGELFSLIYYVNWAKYIASVYSPGVVFEYFSMDVCIERMNNVPHEQTDIYNDSFRKLLDWVKPYLPEGVIVKYTRYGELYSSREQFYEELDISKQKWLANNDGKLPELDDAQIIATELNVKLKPGQDQDPYWREKVELEHQGLFNTKTGGAYMSDPTMIPNCPTWYSGFIATGSTKQSLAKFWVGVGALGHTIDGYSQLILSPKQLKSAKFDWQTVNIDGLNGKNFAKIRVLS